ncbi:hypothetical protein BGZ65_002897 [Modicella reniformis]|uniref:Mannosyltransferase n=1 Tax=Modicella reniformis TaxID=1440133 RepID=A0A9P6J0N7_9FUNG|nr:hypothetical protein BGZ65_002897 [Modicella reniformis]
MTPPSPRLHRLKDTTLLTALIVFRTINACLVKTYFSPDEHWQALEVAHWITFGYGYLTWEWTVALRSVLHPALFAGLYKALAVLGIDDGWLFIYAPRLLQSLFAAIADFYAYQFADRLFENQLIANWTLFLSVTSWWNFFCSTRTLANSTEAALTIVALYYWPFSSVPPSSPSSPASSPSPSSPSEPAHSGKSSCQGHRTISLGIAFLTCVFRPTAAIMWIFMGVVLLIQYCMDSDRGSILTTLISVFIMSGSTILGTAILDSTLLYNEWVLTPINFLRVNVLQGISLFYGSSPWHWYLSQGLPLLFGIYLPFVLSGAWHALKSDTALNARMKHQVLYLSLWMLVVYSSLQHKEWRFLYPILYPLLPFAGHTFYNMFLPIYQDGTKSKSKMAITVVLLGVVIVNAVMAWYATMVHQRGVIDVMEWIRQEARVGQIRSAGFLMPCHSTPWLSSTHRRGAEPLNMWFVTCEPPLGNVDHATYKDESDIFYEDPVTFMDERVTKMAQENLTKDSHLIMFQDLLRSWPKMPQWMNNHGYREVKRTRENTMEF